MFDRLLTSAPDNVTAKLALAAQVEDAVTVAFADQFEHWAKSTFPANNEHSNRLTRIRACLYSFIGCRLAENNLCLGDLNAV